MTSIADMDAHLAYLKAWRKKCYEDTIAEVTEELKIERNPYHRDFLEEHRESAKRKLAAEESLDP